ncbi:hypothetical protein GW17_00024121, partial [Ensete ventricosum]
YPTLRVESFEEQASDKQLQKNLNLLEEQRAEAHLTALAYKKDIVKLYNRKVHPRQIMTGDLVLWKAEVSDPTCARDKLAPDWEGPYRVVDTVRERTYT